MSDKITQQRCIGYRNDAYARRFVSVFESRWRSGKLTYAEVWTDERGNRRSQVVAIPRVDRAQPTK